MPLLLWLQGLPWAAALIVIAGLFLACAAALTWTGRTLGARFDLPHAPSTLAPATSSIGTMASILIGLVIVGLWNDYRLARVTVSSEATELRGAARDAHLLAPASRDVLLRHLQDYATAVAVDEWPAMDRGTYASSAGRALAALIVDANATRTASFDVRQRISRIGELRTTRLSQTTTGVVPPLWFALLAIPIVMLAAIGLAHDENALSHYLLVMLASLAMAIAIFVAVEIDVPYHGVSAVSPEPIRSAIQNAVEESVER